MGILLITIRLNYIYPIRKRYIPYVFFSSYECIY